MNTEDLSPVARLGSGASLSSATKPRITPHFAGQGKIVAADKNGNVPPGFTVISPGGMPMVVKESDCRF